MTNKRIQASLNPGLQGSIKPLFKKKINEFAPGRMAHGRKCLQYEPRV